MYKAIAEGIAFTEYPIWFQIIAYYATGTHFLFFWFIPVIILIYLLSPLLIKLDKYEYFYYSLPLFFMLSVFVQREIYIGLHNPLNSLVHFIFFYILGMAASRYRDKLLFNIQKNWLLYTISFGLITYIDYNLYENLLGYLVYVSRYTLSCLFILFVLYRFDKQIGKTFHTLAAMSFGIYFLHGYVLSILWRIGQKFHLVIPPISANIGYYLLLSTIILIATCLVLWAIKKIFNTKSRMIVGY